MPFPLYTFKKDIDIEGLYTFFYSEHTKDFYFPGEKHDFWELVYVDDGEISAVADNTNYMVHQGEIIFHKPMEFHALAANKKDPHNILVVTFETQSRAMRFFENKIFATDIRQKKLLSLLLSEAQFCFSGELNEKNPPQKSAPIGSFQLALSYLEQLLISLARGNAADDRRLRKSPYARKNTENALADAIENYLAENVRGALTLSDICQKFHLGKSCLCELFKENTGVSIMERYTHLKIVEAKKLIRKGTLNVTQIAETLGYGSIHSFTRSFKNKTGFTPSGYAGSVK